MPLGHLIDWCSVDYDQYMYSSGRWILDNTERETETEYVYIWMTDQIERDKQMNFICEKSI